MHFRSIERHTTYTAVLEDGHPALRAVSDCSASALWLPLDDVDLARTPRLSWRWRVEEIPDVADERSRAGDDFAARVYLMFRLDPERASWLERARRRFARAIYGREPPGSALSFVWSARSAPGEIWDNPFESATKMVALASGPPGGWRVETVDVAAEYRRAFDRPPPPLLGLAIMSDSDGSCQRAAARFADFRLLGPPS